ncbi:MAG TPA: LPS export ABC transporter ATP-binding protein [Xanthobacteraceae bacterium]|jgi:lipopolysaccharide export system ATP-binding protein|nr:LPS export ABC transporter ATP-binding protein [Xanthobacteraceae bacterium]
MQPSPTTVPPRAGIANPQWLAAYRLQKRFGERQVVHDVSLNLTRGEAVALLGPNGAGKTTVFYMIAGIIPADSGTVEIDGKDVTAFPLYLRARMGLGYLPQEPSIFPGLSVEKNLMVMLEAVEPDRARREAEAQHLLDEFELTRVRNTLGGALSGGERRRAEIARALAARPAFIMLDEPFAAIDPLAVNDIRDLVMHLKDRGIGVLITDHNVRETLGIVDRAYIVHAGTLLMEGYPDEILASRKVRDIYLGDNFRL